MSREQKKLATYFFILVIPFLFLFLNPTVFVSFKTTFVESMSLPIRVISFPFREIRKIFLYHHTYNQYQKLQQEVDTLKTRLIGLEEVMVENNRYKRLLDLKKNLVFSSITANVIGRDPSNWNAVIILDKGSQDGLALGMPVVNALGVVGKIAEVSENTSKVILVSDPSFSVAALIQSTREGGLVTGTLQGMSRMHYLPQESEVALGDKVLTSKLSSSFPEGLLIGEVIKVEVSQSTPTIECLVQPAVSLSQIEEVLILQK